MIHELDDGHTVIDIQTGTAWRHRPRLCIASRGKNSRFWSITAGCSRLITIWTTGLAYRTWATAAADDDDEMDPVYRGDKLRLFVNGTITDVWTILYDASYRSYVKDKLSKKPFPHIGRPLKISPPKWRNPSVGQNSTIMLIFKPIGARYLSPGKNTYFLYRRLPWGLPSHAIHFWKALVEPLLRPIWHVALRVTVFEIFVVKMWNFGALLGVPAKGRLCVRARPTIMEHFTPSPRYL